jgi:UDP-glucuronate 4-epimerase
MFGDGEQTRSNTYVADCVKATMLAAENREAALGQVFNVGGGEIVSLNEVIRQLEELTGRKAVIERKAAAAGRSEAHRGQHREGPKRLLGYQPTTPVQRAWPRRWPGRRNCSVCERNWPRRAGRHPGRRAWPR